VKAKEEVMRSAEKDLSGACGD